MARNIGNDFSRDNPNQSQKLWRFKCVCGFEDTKAVETMKCSCGATLKGKLVYHKIGKHVILDKRFS